MIFTVGSVLGGFAESMPELITYRAIQGIVTYRDIVVLNAAAALIVAGKADGLKHGAELARQSIDTGAAAARLDALVQATNEVLA